jgi:DNA-binding NtrC family response regulator
MLPPIRVVIVDDANSDTGALVAECLRGDLYETVLRVDAREALDQAVQGRRPVVLFLGSIRHLAGVLAPLEASSLPEGGRVILATGARAVPKIAGLVVLKKPFTIEALVAAFAEVSPASAPTTSHAA